MIRRRGDLPGAQILFRARALTTLPWGQLQVLGLDHDALLLAAPEFLEAVDSVTNYDGGLINGNDVGVQRRAV